MVQSLTINRLCTIPGGLRSVRTVGFSLILACTGLTACLPAADCSRADILCAGLVTNTAGVGDHGLNQNAWEGLQQAREQGLADQIAYIESVDARDYSRNITAFGDDHYDIVITVGAAMDDETLHAAERYPGTVFIGIDQTRSATRPNLLSATVPADQMGFWAGALAARLTQTDIIGGVCEISGIDSMWQYCEGFRQGAVSTDETAEVLILYREQGSSERLFSDADWGLTAGRDLIARGADVIFAAGGGTGQGALRAAAEAGVYAIGSEADQAQALTDAASALITSVYGRVDRVVLEEVRLIRAGRPVQGEVVMSFGNTPYREIKLPIPSSIKAEMDQLMTDLSTGVLKTGVPLQAP